MLRGLNMRPVLLLGSLFTLATGFAVGQAAITITTDGQAITITEPGVIPLADLYRKSDVVALVRIVSGDGENYAETVYKSIVVRPFKGAKQDQELYFGPFIGYRIGQEYIAFLQLSKRPQRAAKAKAAFYGKLDRFYRIFLDGYSFLETSYVCVFDGSAPRESCDQGVSLNIEYVPLPAEVKTFPREQEDEIRPRKVWVRKSEFLSLLERIGKRG
jgi:hypothetical protein